ncbi:Werner Syndrome-like exonuclease [Ananas comosus]|uniref:Werner Syndrome-like exonuclease n=1 Tax=Ananas comosus TaxID=4615 RepID=A0A6P5EXU7_ANACO|nr:Werner Syndrome-like exonuclease [Ananas comosus]
MSISVETHSDTLFTVIFNGSDEILTTVTSSGADAEAWVAEVLRVHRHRLDRLVVGLDAEWRPNFSAGAAPNPVALVQLCVGRRCLVFSLLHADYVPLALANFLADTRFAFVGVGVAGDAERLADECGLPVADAVDLRDLAAERTGRRQLKQMGLAGLAAEIMEVEVRKPSRVRMSRWDRRDLTLDQIGYACVDAFLSFEIGRRLFAGEF